MERSFAIRELAQVARSVVLLGMALVGTIVWAGLRQGGRDERPDGGF